jgi:hypothetical protein
MLICRFIGRIADFGVLSARDARTILFSTACGLLRFLSHIVPPLVPNKTQRRNESSAAAQEPDNRATFAATIFW